MFLKYIDMLINILKRLVMPDLDELLKRRKYILKEISEAPMWVNGSVIESTRTVKGKKYPFYYLSQSIEGKTQTTYISAKQLDQFKTSADEGTRIKKLMTELGIINIKLLKAGCSQ